jgi:hypothetical protein
MNKSSLGVGIEPTTTRLRVVRSANWANQAAVLRKINHNDFACHYHHYKFLYQEQFAVNSHVAEPIQSSPGIHTWPSRRLQVHDRQFPYLLACSLTEKWAKMGGESCCLGQRASSAHLKNAIYLRESCTSPPSCYFMRHNQNFPIGPIGFLLVISPCISGAFRYALLA